MVLFGTEEECPGHYGIIDPALDVQDIVDDAASSAKYLCNHHYGDCPDVKINIFSKSILNILYNLLLWKLWSIGLASIAAITM